MSEWVDINNNCKQSASDSANEISCGSGFRKQSRSYIPAANKGIELDVNSNERKLVIRWVPCSKERCTDVNGAFTPWVNDGYCVKSSSDARRVTCKDNSNPGKQKIIRTYIPKIGNGIEIPVNERFLVDWVNCDTSNMEDCPVTQNGVCSDVQWDASCSCKNNKYQISYKRNYTEPTGDGRDISCDTVPVWVDCNSSNSNNSTFSTLASSIKNTFTPNGLCPSDAILGPETQDPDNTCTNKTTNATTGRGRTKFKSRTCTFPIGNRAHHQEFTNMFINNHNSGMNIVNEFNALQKDVRTEFTVNNNQNVPKKYYITRTNNTVPQQYKIEEEIACADVPIHTEADINSKWQNWTGCTTNFNDIFNSINTNYNELAYANILVAEDKFNPYKLNNMLANTTTDYNKRKACYGTTGYMRIDNSNKSLYTASNVLGPGFTFTKNILDDIVILRSGNYAFSLLNNGNMYIYGPGSNNNTAAFYTVGNLNTISMQHDGNLVIYNTNGTAIWNSGTSGYSGAYLELESNGSLIIKKRDSSNNVTNVKILYSNGLMTVNGNPSNFPAKSEALCTPEFSTSTTPRTQNVTVISYNRKWIT